ncbi:MAG TPA: PEP-CTERM sorting domain-containing protein [Verrucomicrobiota bacterium]|nr:PEP-CTERM sorting domain-containing protein [Verrucomicrobiota bacterium]HNU52388.1 PEP-CTERM sorting domain-containing protein [Verrucomicrobiota bacterium]
MKKLLAAMAGLAILPFLASAQTTYLYDGFDYSVGGLQANSGGVWTPGWESVGVTSPGLTYGALGGIGNKASTGANGTGGGMFHMMPTGFNALNSTVWISFVGQADTAAGAGWSGISPFNGADSETLFLGNPGQDPVGGARFWGVHLYNALGDPGVPTGGVLSPLSVDNQIFAVTRIINGASSAQLTMWINPSLEGEPQVATAAFDGIVGRIPFDRIRVAGSNDGVVSYDELRVGDSYAAVIPEPSTLALLALGGLALTLVRRQH